MGRGRRRIQLLLLSDLATLLLNTLQQTLDLTVIWTQVHGFTQVLQGCVELPTQRKRCVVYDMEIKTLTNRRYV